MTDIERIAGPILDMAIKQETPLMIKRTIRRVEKNFLHNANKQSCVVRRKVLILKEEMVFRIFGYIKIMPKPKGYKSELFDREKLVDILLNAWYLNKNVILMASYRKSVNSILQIAAIKIGLNRVYAERLYLNTIRQSGRIFWYTRHKEEVDYDSLAKNNNLRII